MKWSLFGISLFGILAVAVCLLPLAGTAQEPASHPQEPALLKVVTYNIRYANPGDGADIWPHRIDAVTSFLKEYDIAGLQEVTPGQLNDLRQRLGDFDSYGVGRDDGKDQGEHAVIFYRRDRLEAVDQGTFWLSETPEHIGVRGWDAALPRTCTWMILRERGSGKSVLVANTHFDHRGAVARAESGKLVREQLLERAGELPVILLGDFNCRNESEPYQAITAGDYLKDARSVSRMPPSGPESTWNGFDKIVTGQIIDHIFVHGGLDVLAVTVLDPKTSAGRFASDHLPVRALIRFQSPLAESE